MSIRQRLLWVLSVSLAAIMVAHGWMHFLSAEEPIDAAFDHALLDDAYAVVAHVRATPGGIAVEMPEDAADVLRTDPDDAFYFLVVGPGGGISPATATFPSQRLAHRGRKGYSSSITGASRCAGSGTCMRRPRGTWRSMSHKPCAPDAAYRTRRR